jgi:hypothetical protein
MTKSFKPTEEQTNAEVFYRHFVKPPVKESMKYFMDNLAPVLSKKPTISKKLRNLQVTILDKIDDALS